MLKKILCLLLTLWLPLFSGMASALSLQMSLQQKLLQQATSSAHTCHQNADAAPQTLPDKQRICFSCGVCAFAHAGMNVQSTLVSEVMHIESDTQDLFTPSFYSQAYPPADKPPRLI